MGAVVGGVNRVVSLAIEPCVFLSDYPFKDLVKCTCRRRRQCFKRLLLSSVRLLTRVWLWVERGLEEASEQTYDVSANVRRLCKR